MSTQLETTPEAAFEKILTFEIADEIYGLGVEGVSEIISMQRIIQVPDTPDFIRGVINLRGTVVPVMDVRVRFGLEAREYDDRTCIIVIETNATQAGLVVDTIAEVIDIPRNQIDCFSHGSGSPAKCGSSFIRGLGKIGKDVKILLDAEALLHEERAEA